MAAAILKKVILSNPKLIGKDAGIFCLAARNHWNYQYKPGPYPKTPEERAAAAKKYGLTLEEYQPFPESMCFGDYPKLPDIGADSKDPHYPWDMPDLRRNFNETLHVRSEIYGGDRYDISMRPRFSVMHQLRWFLGTLFGFMALYFYMEDYKFGRPVTAKQYPGQDAHYLFSPK